MQLGIRDGVMGEGEPGRIRREELKFDLVVQPH